MRTERLNTSILRQFDCTQEMLIVALNSSGCTNLFTAHLKQGKRKTLRPTIIKSAIECNKRSHKTLKTKYFRTKYTPNVQRIVNVHASNGGAVAFTGSSSSLLSLPNIISFPVPLSRLFHLYFFLLSSAFCCCCLLLCFTTRS